MSSLSQVLNKLVLLTFRASFLISIWRLLYLMRDKLLGRRLLVRKLICALESFVNVIGASSHVLLKKLISWNLKTYSSWSCYHWLVYITNFALVCVLAIHGLIQVLPLRQVIFVASMFLRLVKCWLLQRRFCFTVSHNYVVSVVNLVIDLPSI